MWRRYQNELVLKEKGKKKQEKRNGKKETGSPRSFKLSYITESELVVLSPGKKKKKRIIWLLR